VPIPIVTVSFALADSENSRTTVNIMRLAPKNFLLPVKLDNESEVVMSNPSGYQ
jgi:hypothetical protein